jgi:hypothetical protein
MNTTENNKLLAEFLGWSKKINKEGEETPFYNLPIELHNHLGITQHIPLEGFVFDTDWNWLMQVVEKIIKDFYKLNPCPIYLKMNIEKQLIATDKEGIYNACIEFVKWYNEQNK